MGKRLAALALSALVSSGAQADVVYNWETIEAGNVPPFTAQLRFDESRRGLGGNEYVWSSRSGVADPAAPVLQLFVGGEGGLNLMPRLGSGIVDPSGITFSPLAVRLQVRPNGLLTGLIFGDNGNLAIDFEADNPNVWFITNFTRDNPNAMICSNSTPRFGPCTTTGRWVLDTSDIPGRVPEPGILPLMALASIGLGISLRRRNK